jgi:hypothetical protein
MVLAVFIKLVIIETGKDLLNSLTRKFCRRVYRSQLLALFDSVRSGLCQSLIPYFPNQQVNTMSCLLPGTYVLSLLLMFSDKHSIIIRVLYANHLSPFI